jgi:pentatricopeptide repeat protein
MLNHAARHSCSTTSPTSKPERSLLPSLPLLQGVQPVLRTFNTLIIACNMCNQPREAVAVYRRMLEEGYSPNSTT